MAEKTKPLSLHAIQLKSVSVEQLYIKAHQPPDNMAEPDKKEFSLVTGHSKYNNEKKTIQVGLKLEIGFDDGGKEDDSCLFSMRIELVADFTVDENKFKTEYLGDWANRNAPFILYPFIREHVYALSSRCGFRPATLPLLEVPTLITNDIGKGKGKGKGKSKVKS